MRTRLPTQSPRPVPEAVLLFLIIAVPFVIFVRRPRAPIVVNARFPQRVLIWSAGLFAVLSIGGRHRSPTITVTDASRSRMRMLRTT
jgi:hypothetical protein